MLFEYKNFNTATLNGRRHYVCDTGCFPSITTVLSNTMPAEKQRWLDEWAQSIGKEEAEKITADAAHRGTNVHEMIELHFKDELDVSKYDELFAGIFRSLKFELKKIQEILGMEVALYSDVLGVAGRTDMIAFYDDELSVIDFKTTRRHKTEEDIADYWLQIAFYAIAHNEKYNTGINQGVIIMGNENGIPQKWVCKDLSVHYDRLLKRITQYYEEV